MESVISAERSSLLRHPSTLSVSTLVSGVFQLSTMLFYTRRLLLPMSASLQISFHNGIPCHIAHQASDSTDMESRAVKG